MQVAGCLVVPHVPGRYTWGVIFEGCQRVVFFVSVYSYHLHLVMLTYQQVVDP